MNPFYHVFLITYGSTLMDFNTLSYSTKYLRHIKMTATALGKKNEWATDKCTKQKYLLNMVVRRQIWGEVVWFIPVLSASALYLRKCKSEKKIKICRHLPGELSDDPARGRHSEDVQCRTDGGCGQCLIAMAVQYLVIGDKFWPMYVQDTSKAPIIQCIDRPW